MHNINIICYRYKIQWFKNCKGLYFIYIYYKILAVSPVLYNISLYIILYIIVCTS